MNCYDCYFKNNVPGDAHICCSAINSSEQIIALQQCLNFGKVILNNGKNSIKFNSYGIKSGWCNYPINFDPNWVESCDIFRTPKDIKKLIQLTIRKNKLKRILK